MRIAAVVQARMSSQRLPGKVLAPLAGRPALEYLLERLERVRGLDDVVVATSDDASDDPVAAFCAARGTACVRGPLEDVAARIAAAVAGLDAFVRISGDSPLLDPRLVEQGLALFAERRPDLVTNVLPRTFPKGQSVEVIDARVFLETEPELRALGDREHVTTFFYAHPERFRIESFTVSEPAADVSLALDTPEDLARLDAVLRSMTRRNADYGWAEIVALAGSIGHRP